MSFTSRALDLADGDPVRAEAVKSAVVEMFETGLKMKAAGYQFVPGAGVINPRQQQMIAALATKGVTADTVKEWDLANRLEHRHPVLGSYPVLAGICVDPPVPEGPDASQLGCTRDEGRSWFRVPSNPVGDELGLQHQRLSVLHLDLFNGLGERNDSEPPAEHHLHR